MHDQSAGPTSEQDARGRFSTAQQLGEAVRDAALDAGSARGVVEARNSDGLFSGVAAYEFRADGVLLAGEVSVSEPVSAELGLVLSPDATYVRVPPAAAVFTGSQWLRVRADDSSGLAGQITALTAALGADLPGTSLLLGERRDATVSYRGEERLAGEDVERYLAEWDDGAVTTTEEYWIDPDDRVLRVDSLQRGPVGVTAEGRRTYTDWGEPVAVEAPPAEQVGELPDGFF
jgi:hypothetical protein